MYFACPTFEGHEVFLCRIPMLQIILNKIKLFYSAKNRWWVPLVAGLMYGITLPPFNHHTHPLLFPFPFFSFIVFIPLFFFATQQSLKRSVIHSYLFGITASLAQFYWIANVVAEGLWHLILIGLGLMSLVVGLNYLAAGVLFRFTTRRFGNFAYLLFPSLWVMIEYFRSITEIAFPWALLGYSVAPVLPLAQLSSVIGVYGFSFLLMLGNMVLWRLIKGIDNGGLKKRILWAPVIFAAGILIVSVGGSLRLARAPESEKSLKVGLLQTNINQNQWGNRSLDTSFAITESLTYKAAEQDPDLIILPESALLCYLPRRRSLKDRVYAWRDSVKIPMIIGTLNWEPAPKNSYYRRFVYNAALYLDSTGSDFDLYYKIKLVPFSEAMPFEHIVPILSRVNLGEADFMRGKEYSLFEIEGNYKAAPFICYEIIFPGFVRKRIAEGASLLINITNDGWFGRSSAPFHHAAMARMRCIENGIPLARCANSGISMIVDQYGRVREKTGLYERGVLVGEVPLGHRPTFYTRFGDWPVVFSFLVILVGLGLLINSMRRKTEGP
ncbi:MAG: apolipoprotein N-acyltransferase [Chitinivibrionales bacterium]|nr:apolipoprotein N-acyltransferase [Chitinivibrionales bacterium]